MNQMNNKWKVFSEKKLFVIAAALIIAGIMIFGIHNFISGERKEKNTTGDTPITTQTPSEKDDADVSDNGKTVTTESKKKDNNEADNSTDGSKTETADKNKTVNNTNDRKDGSKNKKTETTDKPAVNTTPKPTTKPGAGKKPENGNNTGADSNNGATDRPVAPEEPAKPTEPDKTLVKIVHYVCSACGHDSTDKDSFMDHVVEHALKGEDNGYGTYVEEVWQ